MLHPRILRVRRVDATDESPFCLVSLTPSGKKNDATLNLRLLATEGSMAFVGNLQHDQLQRLRSKNYAGTPSEWESLLSRTLLHSPITAEHASALEGVELISSLGGEKTLTLTWQRKKRTATQTLGSITLDETDEYIDPFFWTGDAVEAADVAEKENEQLREQVSGQDATISKLREQLQSLVDAKLEHEKALLDKFAGLINSKKLKIRDQQRLLAGAKVDPSAAGLVRDSRKGQSSTTAGGRPAGKRKAAVKEDSESDDESSDAFEDASMKDVEEQRTPEPSEDDTDDDDDDERVPTPPPVKQAVRRAIGGRGKAAVPASSPAKATKFKMATPKTSPAASRTAKKSPEIEQVSDSQKSSIPPRRELPFTRKPLAAPKQASPPKKQATPPPDDDSETEDEL